MQLTTVEKYKMLHLAWDFDCPVLTLLGDLNRQQTTKTVCGKRAARDAQYVTNTPANATCPQCIAKHAARVEQMESFELALATEHARIQTSDVLLEMATSPRSNGLETAIYRRALAIQGVSI